MVFNMKNFNKLVEETLSEINWSKGEMNAMGKGITKRKQFCPGCGMVHFVYPGKYNKACSACGFVAEPVENPIKDGDIRKDSDGAAKGEDLNQAQVAG